jgi:hypothetical protein
VSSTWYAWCETRQRLGSRAGASSSGCKQGSAWLAAAGQAARRCGWVYAAGAGGEGLSAAPATQPPAAAAAAGGEPGTWSTVGVLEQCLLLFCMHSSSSSGKVGALLSRPPLPLSSSHLFSKRVGACCSGAAA